jgi:hypothetical protein
MRMAMVISAQLRLLSANRPDRISSRIDCSAGLRTPSARRWAMPAKPCLKAFWLPGGPDLPRMPAMDASGFLSMTLDFNFYLD